MGKTAAKAPQAFTEMVSDGHNQRTSSGLYGESTEMTVSEMSVSELLHAATSELAKLANADRITLLDTETVKKILCPVFSFMLRNGMLPVYDRTCAEHGIFSQSIE